MSTNVDLRLDRGVKQKVWKHKESRNSDWWIKSQPKLSGIPHSTHTFHTHSTRLIKGICSRTLISEGGVSK